jgi:hypothetical protein
LRDGRRLSYGGRQARVEGDPAEATTPHLSAAERWGFFVVQERSEAVRGS